MPEIFPGGHPHRHQEQQRGPPRRAVRAAVLPDRHRGEPVPGLTADRDELTERPGRRESARRHAGRAGAALRERRVLRPADSRRGERCSRIDPSTPSGTRTHTRAILSRLPLPIGLWGPVVHRIGGRAGRRAEARAATRRGRALLLPVRGPGELDAGAEAEDAADDHHEPDEADEEACHGHYGTPRRGRAAHGRAPHSLHPARVRGPSART